MTTINQVNKRLEELATANNNDNRPPFVVLNKDGVIVWPEGAIPPGRYKGYSDKINPNLWDD